MVNLILSFVRPMIDSKVWYLIQIKTPNEFVRGVLWNQIRFDIDLFKWIQVSKLDKTIKNATENTNFGFTKNIRSKKPRDWWRKFATHRYPF